MKTFLLWCAVLAGGVLFIQCRSTSASRESGKELSKTIALASAELPIVEESLRQTLILPQSSYPEIYGYVMSGREHTFRKDMPVSDLFYFAAEPNVYGNLVGVPNRKKLAAFRGKVHLVVAAASPTLFHFILREGSEERRQLVKDIAAASKNFDGLQIDFEQVHKRDEKAFVSFLKEVRSGIGNKLFSIAIPARTHRIANEAYDYQTLAAIADKILVMAYDEHWSGSKPGPIASMEWCRKVAEYSIQTIGPHKLIMGLPFYGRSWGSFNPNTAYIFSSIEEVQQAQGIKRVNRTDAIIPMFEYERPVTVTVYYEDEQSIAFRLAEYRSLGVQSVGFWRIGQESPGVWQTMRLERNK
ncbi:MAG: glycoside hydrolase [Treponema sp.]|jgi:spore germination protein YaaH|nr:glycoside hydrolase [Treponema sp.]